METVGIGRQENRMDEDKAVIEWGGMGLELRR